MLLALLANSHTVIKNSPAEKAKVPLRTENIFPKKFGDKNKENVGKDLNWVFETNTISDWLIFYEKKNWYRNHSCTRSWGWKGARVCEEYARAPGAFNDSIAIRWCKGH